MKKIFLFTLLITSLSLQAQTEDKDAMDYSIPVVNLRASVVPWLLGNGGGLVNSAGLEYIFFNRHSLVLDFGLNVGQDNNDDITDTAGVKHAVGNRFTSNEKAILLSYRYYFRNYRTQRNLYYASVFARQGKINRERDPLFFNDFVHEEEQQRSAGILLGAIFRINESERFTFDLNSGIFYKEKEISTAYLQSGMMKRRYETGSNLGMRIGVSFCFALGFYKDQ